MYTNYQYLGESEIMKITDIKIEKIKLKLKEPFKVAFAVIEYSEDLIVKITTDEGITGFGEASPIQFVTGETVDTAYAALKLLKEVLIGEDPLAIDRIHAVMDATIIGNTSAKCGIDLALYDIKGKTAGLPVYKLLGGYSNRIENDTTLSLDEPEKMAHAAKCRADEGYRIIKIKTGIDLESDIRSIRAIREAVGPSVRLRVDANQGYTIPAALKAIRVFAEEGIESIEQCLPAGDVDGAAYLRSKAAPGIELMLDESIHSPADAARACKVNAADSINIKLMKCGGLYRGEQIYSVAEAYGLKCMVGCMMESKLANTAGLSLAAAKKFIPDADCDSYTVYSECDQFFEGGFTTDGPMVTLSEEPGFGVKVNM